MTLLWFPQDASRAFRRQLEDKRAVIENNLLTGKQHLGAKNEGPSSLSSDTSESDGKNAKGLYWTNNKHKLVLFCLANDFQELNRGIRREVSRLSEHWIVLLRKAEEWHKQLDEMLPVRTILMISFLIKYWCKKVIQHSILFARKCSLTKKSPHYFLLFHSSRKFTRSKRALKQWCNVFMRQNANSLAWIKQTTLLVYQKTKFCCSGISSRWIEIMLNLSTTNLIISFLYFQIQSANLQPLQRMVEDINDQASDFTACNIALSTQILLRLEDINTR